MDSKVGYASNVQTAGLPAGRLASLHDLVHDGLKESRLDRKTAIMPACMNDGFQSRRAAALQA